jgi:hypothetical protein
MNARAIPALVAAPLCAALVHVVLAMMTPHRAIDSSVYVPMFISSLSVAGLFELCLLVPIWYILRCATLGTRVVLAVVGIALWFVAASALGFVLGHGGPIALRFGLALLLPGVIVAAVFAMLVPARVHA